VRTRSGTAAFLVGSYVVLYVAAGQWGIHLATVGTITPWYVPPGLSVALVLFLGRRTLPALAVAEGLTALVSGDYSAPQLVADVLVTTTAYGAAGLLLRPAPECDTAAEPDDAAVALRARGGRGGPAARRGLRHRGRGLGGPPRGGRPLGGRAHVVGR
jgi:hypothetical protein